jgi:hypothetical protein
VRRRLSALLLTFLSVLLAAAVAAPAAHAGPGEGEFTSRANSERSARGIPRYAVRSDLVAVARRHAQRMAGKQNLYHNPNLGSEVDNWQEVGENVGVGGSVSSIHQAFMNSAGHRANILDRAFTEVGMGTATDGEGKIWVVQVFRKPMHSTAPTTASKPRSQPVAKAPAPRPRRLQPARAATRSASAAPTRQAAPAAVPLSARLASARAAATGARSGALSRAVSYHGVMRTLAG